MKKITSMILKLFAVLASLGGVLLGQITARADGYSAAWRRLLYFTAQSNLALGITLLLLLCLRGRAPRWLLMLRYMFTVSIVLTGLVFCLVLAPFAGEGYTPWTLTNLLTHVASPLLALFDFLLDRARVKNGMALSLLPPLGYVIAASLLGLLGVDFGRGVTYPYFFLNYCSPVGLFGVGGERPFVLGAFYWIAVLLGAVLSVAWLLGAGSEVKE